MLVIAEHGQTQVGLMGLVLVVIGKVVLALELGLARGHQTVKVEFVGVTFSVHFGHYVFVVVVPEMMLMVQPQYLTDLLGLRIQICTF